MTQKDFISSRKCVRRSASVVISGPSAASVIPEKRVKCEKGGSPPSLPGVVIGDRAHWLDKLIV